MRVRSMIVAVYFSAAKLVFLLQRASMLVAKEQVSIAIVLM